VDHQLGEVTGMALDHALLFGFAPREDAGVRLRSHNYPGVIEFSLQEHRERPLGDWGDYARGAVYALRRRFELHTGLNGIVDGCEDVGGLSSSAAAGVAYLLALEAANSLNVSPEENIELDRIVENEYIGLNNGILDQSVILLSRKGLLTYVDCQSGRKALYPCRRAAELRVVILYSGLSRQLCDTDYNRRVAECEEAAGLLLEAGGRPAAQAAKLRHVPPAVFQEFKQALPPPLRRRAEHFFGEQRRVHEGVRLWREGELESFCRLVTESGQSSIDNYECGNQYLRTAFRILRDTSGVLGARFSGAGFRGCCIGLLDGEPRAGFGEDVLSRYLAEHPDMKGRASVRVWRPGDGAALVTSRS
jgi:galactokinase